MTVPTLSCRVVHTVDDDAALFAQDRLPYRDEEPRGPFARARYFHMFQLCKYWVKAKGVSEPSPKGSILPTINKPNRHRKIKYKNIVAQHTRPTRLGARAEVTVCLLDTRGSGPSRRSEPKSAART